MYGGYTDPGILELSDKELLGWLKREVEDLLKISGGPEFVQIYRWPRGIPQFTLDHGRRLAAIEAGEARHPGLAFAGNAYRGVGLNDCVVSAHRAVGKLALPSPGSSV
jgi:oxygen-dependent protoporphyrinogen oxidase